MNSFLKRIFKGKYTEEEKAKIEKDFELLKDRIRSYYRKSNEEIRASNRRTNNRCPNCGNKEESSIVNKITRVQGEGHVDGGLFWTSGSSKTDTNEARHCNKCGNQWKTASRKEKWYSDGVEDCLRGLNYWAEYDWKANIYNKEFAVFKNICYQAILKLIKEDLSYNKDYVVRYVDKRMLKKKFPLRDTYKPKKRK